MPTMSNSTVSNEARAEVFKLSESGAISESDISADKELRGVYRDLAKRSLFFLAKAVLGYKDMTVRTHMDFCKKVQDLSILKLLSLLPRGCFKTSINTIALPIQILLNNPDAEILINNQKATNAERMLSEVEQHLDGSNVMMNWLFEEYIRPGDKHKPWNTQMMKVPCRDAVSGTPSIYAIGIGVRVESWHFDVILNDDLIGREAMQSMLAMLDAITYHDYSVSLFKKPALGVERAVGTRWTLADLYSRMLNSGDYEVFLRQAEDPITGELYFPEVITREFLQWLKDKNFALYMSQYMNNPQNPAALDFREEWLNYYSLVKTNGGPCCEMQGTKYYVKDMDVILVVDPAASGDIETNVARMVQTGTALRSNNAVGVVGLHKSGMHFLLDLWAGRGRGENPELEVAEHMLEMVRNWHGYLRRGYVEAYGAQRALITVFNMLKAQNNLFFPLEEIPRGLQKAKKVRIRSFLGPVAQNGQLAVRRCHGQFTYEYKVFPMGELEDTVDMMAWACAMLRRPASEVDEVATKRRHAQKKRNRLRVIGASGY